MVAHWAHKPEVPGSNPGGTMNLFVETLVLKFVMISIWPQLLSEITQPLALLIWKVLYKKFSNTKYCHSSEIMPWHKWCQRIVHFMGFERSLPSHIIVILFCLSMLDNDDDMAEIELIYDEFDPKGQVPLS